MAALAFAVVAASGCASLEGKKHFAAGRRAENAADLEAALREYNAALSVDPKNKSFDEAVARVRSRLVEALKTQARTSQAQGDTTRANDLWTRVVAIVPDDPEAKLELSIHDVESRRRDPVAFIEAARQLAAAVPSHDRTARLLEEAKAAAFAHYVQLGDAAYTKNAYVEAGSAYESARAIDPSAPVFLSPKYRLARARQLEGVGDEKLKSGAALRAAEAYEEAMRFTELPNLKAKLAHARRRAGPLFEQLEQARSLERQAKWDEAADIYTAIGERPDAPKDVVEARARTRQKSVERRTERAQELIVQGAVDRAQAMLTLAMAHFDGEKASVDELTGALDALAHSDLEGARARLERVPDDGLTRLVKNAASALLSLMVGREWDAIKKHAAKDPADALVRLERLRGFHTTLPGMDGVKAALSKKAFVQLVDRATSRAKDGNEAQAIEFFQRALEAASVPQTLRATMDDGKGALLRRDFRAAKDAFSKASQADARSRLAQAGLIVASQLHLFVLRAAPKIALQKEDYNGAVIAYRALLAEYPNETESSQAFEGLKTAMSSRWIGAAQTHRASKRPGSAFVYYRRVLDLDEANHAAKSAFAELAREFETQSTVGAWVLPIKRGDRLGDACPNAEIALRDRLALYLHRTQGLGVTFVAPDAMKAVDKKERAVPEVSLLCALERCATEQASGSIAVSFQVRVAETPLLSELVKATYSPKAVVKDDPDDVPTPSMIESEVMSAAAKDIVALLRQKSDALLDWPVLNARAEIAHEQVEPAAQSYARLWLLRDKATPPQQKAMAEVLVFLSARLP